MSTATVSETQTMLSQRILVSTGEFVTRRVTNVERNEFTRVLHGEIRLNGVTEFVRKIPHSRTWTLS